MKKYNSVIYTNGTNISSDTDFDFESTIDELLKILSTGEYIKKCKKLHSEGKINDSEKKHIIDIIKSGNFNIVDLIFNNLPNEK